MVVIQIEVPHIQLLSDPVDSFQESSFGGIVFDSLLGLLQHADVQLIFVAPSAATSSCYFFKLLLIQFFPTLSHCLSFQVFDFRCFNLFLWSKSTKLKVQVLRCLR